MRNIANKIAKFALLYPYLALGVAALILLTANLVLRLGEPVAGEVDVGSIIAFFSLSAIFTLAGVDVRRLWEDRTNG
jgi:low temperature requirement protein LtrA